MMGGLSRFRVRCCAPTVLAGLAALGTSSGAALWGTLASSWVAPSVATANESLRLMLPDEATEAKARVAPGVNEQSILVAEGRRADPAALDFAVASDLKAPPLEPIVGPSENEPDLAVPDLAVPDLAVPDLADPEGADPERADPELADPFEVVDLDDYIEVVEDGTAPPSSPELTRAAASAPDFDSPDELLADEDETFGDQPELGPACFLGMTPGLSTREEVLSDWGVPVVGGASSSKLIYEQPDFPEVTVFFTGELVELLRVRLANPFETPALVERLGLTRLRPLYEHSVGGKVVATVYPERGVALIHEVGTDATAASDGGVLAGAVADSDNVFQIEVRNLRADDFAARAAQQDPHAYELRIGDLETALQLDPRNALVKRRLSELKLTIGAAVEAERLAAETVELDTRTEEYRLHWAACLSELARYDLAVDQTRQVLESATAPLIVRAQALHRMGLLASLGSQEIAKRAVPLHTKAIDLADELAVDADSAVRRAAQQLLVDAHLAIAEQISLGEFQRKDEFVAQWIGRASALAEEMIAAGDGDLSWRLKIAVAALKAGGNLQPPIDPELWVVEAQEAAAAFRDATADELALAEVDWQLGLAYFHATEIEHRRGRVDEALRFGDTAETLLAPLALDRDQLPDAGFVMGRLYFQLGAVHAVHREDHRQACQWYDRAIDRLLTPVPVTTLARPGQHGDALVSMGVSYWHIGRRARAYELTRAGAELVQQGIGEGLLAETAGSVARDNLAAMGKALGRSETIPSLVDVPVRSQVAEARPERRSPTVPEIASRPERGGGPARTSLRR
jgi:tetratricopeptide (TPR) repeat protein